MSYIVFSPIDVKNSNIGDVCYIDLPLVSGFTQNAVRLLVKIIAIKRSANRAEVEFISSPDRDSIWTDCGILYNTKVKETNNVGEN